VFDRRIPPGATTADAVATLDAVIADLRADGHDLVRQEPWISLPGMALPADHPAVRVVEAAVSAATGREVVAGGVPFATDACRLAGDGSIPCIVLGPGSIDQGHTPDEWVDLGEVRAAVDVYAAILEGAAAGLTRGSH
jgi:acetylornithine deacetylase